MNITWNRIDSEWVSHYTICDNTSRQYANTTELYYVYARPLKPVNVSIAAVNDSCRGESVWLLLLPDDHNTGGSSNFYWLFLLLIIGVSCMALANYQSVDFISVHTTGAVIFFVGVIAVFCFLMNHSKASKVQCTFCLRLLSTCTHVYP